MSADVSLAKKADIIREKSPDLHKEMAPKPL